MHSHTAIWLIKNCQERCRNIESSSPLDAAYLSDYVTDPSREPTTAVVEVY